MPLSELKRPRASPTAMTRRKRWYFLKISTGGPFTSILRQLLLLSWTTVPQKHPFAFKCFFLPKVVLKSKLVLFFILPAPYCIRKTREAATSPLYDTAPLNLCGPAFGRPWVDLRGTYLLRRRHTRLRCQEEGSCSNDDEDEEKRKRCHNGDDNEDDDERTSKRRRKNDRKDKQS